jgi:hypothetical protein
MLDQLEYNLLALDVPDDDGVIFSTARNSLVICGDGD